MELLIFLVISHQVHISIKWRNFQVMPLAFELDFSENYGLKCRTIFRLNFLGGLNAEYYGCCLSLFCKQKVFLKKKITT